MYLKCRHSGVYFLIFVITFPYCFSYYLSAQKTRANIEDYGERLSSLERGRRVSSSGFNDENRESVKLSGFEPRVQEDAAQEEGMSLQDIPVVKLAVNKKQKLLAQYTVDPAENTEEHELVDTKLKSEENSKEHELGDKSLKSEEKMKEQDDKRLKSEEKTKEQDVDDKRLKSEEKTKEQELDDMPLKSEEKMKKQELDDKLLKSEENDVSRGKKEPKNESKLDLTAEHESSTVKQNDDPVTLEGEFPTKCTTDREVTIGNYTPQESHSNEKGHTHGDSHGGDSGGDRGGGGGGEKEKLSKDATDERQNDVDDEPEKKVSKIYKGPKPAKAPDHYIDDM